MDKKLDLLIAVLIFFLAASAVHIGSQKIVSDGVKQENVWFQADIGRVYRNMTERSSNHYRTKVHPLFSLTTTPVIYALHWLGMEKEQAVNILMSFIAGIWLTLFYSLLRFIEIKKIDACLFSLVALLSAASMFWTTVPETYLFGSVTMLLVLVIVALSERRTLPYLSFVSISALSLSMTVTNWMSGIAATFANNSIKRSIRITLDAFVVVTVLWSVQHVLIPSTEFFLLSPEERNYLFIEESGGIYEKTIVFFLHSIVMPAIQSFNNIDEPLWPMFSVQHSAVGSSGIFGLATTIIWSVIFIIGILATIKGGSYKKFKLVLLLIILGQFSLHMIYGDETFLYSLHWAPMLVVLAAFGTTSSLRYLVLGLTVFLIPGLLVNNSLQLEYAEDRLLQVRLSNENTQQRANLKAAMEEYKDADWPRGAGHVLLAHAGSKLEEKGYYEPGGSFSPGFGSFGVSLLFFDQDGTLKYSSNTIPIDKIDQSIGNDEQSIVAKTDFYQAAWTLTGEHEWSLRINMPDGNKLRPVIKVSSCGPSGAPIEHFTWDQKRLSVNDKFEVKFRQSPRNVYFADERMMPSLKRDPIDEAYDWRPDNGFGSALFELHANTEQAATFSTITNRQSQANLPSNNSSIATNLPNRQFTESLKAQLFHLKASTLNNETRPGDPGNYDINWLRDGAYTLVALARLGELDLARDLSIKFAENDFFGGFGSEADAPGLAIWALEEISSRSNDKSFDKLIWPDIERKANLILEMLETKTVLSKPFIGPIVPKYNKKSYGELATFAAPAKDGLIIGKMDHHQPILFINSTAYLGLKRASYLAKRLGNHAHEELYSNRAKELRAAWGKALDTHPDRKNQRTLISALWPSLIAHGLEPELRKLLVSHWVSRKDRDGNFKKTPKWTYFEIAEGHQWLYLGETDRVWKTLDWFWNHQASHGLYTWWEGKGEENTYHLWETVRGWANPEHVTPHYWTAAEMALLQLEMLAYEIVEDDRITVVIGGGVTEEWLKSPISVDNMMLRSGKLGWRWDGSVLNIAWQGADNVVFEPGSVFPKDIQIEQLHDPNKD